MSDDLKKISTISFDLGDNPGKIEFDSPEKAIQWIRDEITAWDIIFKHRQVGIAKIDDPVSNFRTELYQLLTLSESWKENPILNIEAFKDSFYRRYYNYTCICSHGKYGLRIINYKGNLDVKKYALSICILSSQIILNKETDETALKYVLSLGDNIGLDLITLFHAWNMVFSVSVRESEISDQFSINMSRLSSLSKEYSEKITEFGIQASEKISGIEKIETALKANISTSELSKLWEDKLKEHRWAAVCWYIAIALATLVLFCLIKAYVNEGFIPKKFEEIGPSHIIKISVPIVLYIWLLRYLFKMVSLNNSLKFDARERMAMGKSFRALEQQTGGLPEISRQEIIRSLFRPAASVSSDESPVGIFEKMLKLYKNKGE